jgi:predicted MFS family arabinose efflux permease
VAGLGFAGIVGVFTAYTFLHHVRERINRFMDGLAEIGLEDQRHDGHRQQHEREDDAGHVAAVGAAGIVGVFTAYTFLHHVRERINRFMDPESGDSFQEAPRTSAARRRRTGCTTPS